MKVEREFVSDFVAFRIFVAFYRIFVAFCLIFCHIFFTLSHLIAPTITYILALNLEMGFCIFETLPIKVLA